MGGLFKGLSSPLICIALVNAIVFGVYGNINALMKQRESKKKLEETATIKLRREFVAGFCSGVVQCLVTCPMELVKCRMQVAHNHIISSFFPTIGAIFRKEGFRGFYRGLTPTLLRDAPGLGLYFASFQYLIDTQPTKSEQSLLVAGGVAGTLSWIFIYPFDVIKTQLQVNGAKYNHSLVTCSVKMYKEEKKNFKVFFRGYTPTLLRAFPVNAVTFYVVTKTIRLYEEFHLPST